MKDSLEEVADRLKKEGYSVSLAEKGILNVEKDLLKVVLIDLELIGDREYLKRLNEVSDSEIVLLVPEKDIDELKKGDFFNFIVKDTFFLDKLISFLNFWLKRISQLKERIKIDTFMFLYELTERFITAKSEDEILRILLNASRDYAGADRVSIMMYDEKNNVLEIKKAIGIEDSIIRKTRIRPGEGISGWVFKNKRPLLIDGSEIMNESIDEIRDLLKKKDIVSMSVPIALIPIYAKERKIFGVLNISKAKDTRPFVKSDLEFIFLICRQAALAIENLRSQKEREEKLRLKTLFEQYMASEIADMLVSCSKDPVELGQIKDVVILFADIKRFTLLIQRISIETTRSFLNEFFGMITDVVFRFHGTLNKFIGDAALVIFGYPMDLKDLPCSAICAAMEIIRGFNEIKDRWKEKEEAFEDIGIGIGITEGNVFVGNVGTKKRFDFTVIGLDVNLAERLATNATDGEILVSESVGRKLGEEFILEKKSSLSFLRDIEGPIDVYSIKEKANGAY